MLKREVFVLAEYKVVNGNLEYDLVDLIKETTKISKLKEKDSVRSGMMTGILKDFRYLNDKDTKTQVDQIFFTFGYQDLIDLSIKISQSSFVFELCGTKNTMDKYKIIINDNRYKYNKEVKKEIIENVIKYSSITNIETLIRSDISFVREYFFVRGVTNILTEKELYNVVLILIGKNMEMFDQRDIRKFTKLGLMHYGYSISAFYKYNPKMPSLPSVYVNVAYKKNEKTGVYEYIERYGEKIDNFLDLNIASDEKNGFYRYAYNLQTEVHDEVYFDVWEHFEKDDKKRRKYIDKIIDSYINIYNSNLSLALKFIIYDLEDINIMINQDIQFKYQDTTMGSENISKMRETKNKTEKDILYLEDIQKTREKYKLGGEGYEESMEDYEGSKKDYFTRSNNK